MCGGLNAPPRTPTAETAAPSAHLAVAAEDVLGGRQLAQAGWAASVQLLRRVADLGAHPELETIGEPRRRVDIDRRGIHRARERLGGLLRRRDDRLRVACAVAVDMVDRGI